MILTVTPNTALDTVLFVDDFSIGRTARATGSAEGMGGKGAVTSWILARLGVPTVATGLAGGSTGRRMVAILEEAGATTDFLWVAEETRTNYVIARTRDGAQGTITVAGLCPSLEDGVRLAAHVRSLLAGAHYLLCGGSLPDGLPDDWYAPLIAAAREAGVTSLLDVSGRFLAPNVAARPDIIKPNADEAETLLGRPLPTIAAAAEGAAELRARGIGTVLITLGERGAVAATEEGLFYVPPIPVQVINTAGAGDGFNAGLLTARRRGAGWQEALRHAAAVATSILLTPGTGDCRPEDVRALLPRARVERL